MRTYKTVTSQVTRDIEDEIFCDLCETKAKDASWSSSYYNIDDTNIEMQVTIDCKTGEMYPEGGSYEEYIIDLCPKCFKSRLIPWLESQGAKIIPTEHYH